MLRGRHRLHVTAFRRAHFLRDLLGPGREGLANVNEVCISETVMEAPGIHELVGNRVVSRDYENLKGIGQKMEIHRLAIVPISAS